MATTGTMLNDFVSQNAVIILITGILATVVALSAYYIVRAYLPSNSSDSAYTNPTVQEKKSDRSAQEQENEDKDQQPTIDPVYYCEHIQGEIKKVKQGVATRKICESLSSDQIAEEKRRQQDQLAEIFKLMQQQEEKFGISSMEEMQEQMGLYADFK
ncbi:hypothetical protein ACOMHN_049527 [Nucella lapillus]